MPEDRKVLAIKSEYQQKLSEPEVEIAGRAGVEGELKQQLVAVQAEAHEAARSPTLTQQAAMKVLERVVRLALELVT